MTIATPSVAQHQLAVETARRAARRGFSFVEILFAVMILGIGFIMVAGIFPVAISQTQTSIEESHAASLARGGVACVQRLPYTQAFTANNLEGIVQLFDDTARSVPSQDAVGNPTAIDVKPWDLIRGNLILPEDPRLAWVPLWRRPNNAAGQPERYAQLIVVAVQCRNHGAYNASDLNWDNGKGTLVPKKVKLKFAQNFPEPDVVEVSGEHAGAVVPGAFLFPVGVPTDDPNGGPRITKGAGWVLKVGIPTTAGNPAVESTTKFNLEPGADLKGAPANNKPVDGDAYVIGRGKVGAAYEGGVQDIAVYTTFIQLK